MRYCAIPISNKFMFEKSCLSSWQILRQVQSKIFQSRRSFILLGHFDKHFVKSVRKKGPQGNNLVFLLLNTLQTTFWMENLTQRRTQSRAFQPKSGKIFWFPKKAGEDSPPLIARLLDIRNPALLVLVSGFRWFSSASHHLKHCLVQ